MWKHMSDSSKRKAKQKWSLRNQSSMEPDDEEFKRTMKNARRKLEIPMPAAMPCKTPVNCRGETCRSIRKLKTKNACIVDADEHMRIRLETIPQRYHEDHIAAKGMNSLSHYKLAHKFIPMPQALKIAKNKGGKVHFASLMDLCHLKNPDWNLSGHPLAGLLWERQFEKVLLKHGWENSSELGMFLREPRKKTILISVCGRYKTGWKGAEHWSNMENTNERLIWENQHHSSTMFMWAALKEDAKLARILLIITEVCSNQRFLDAHWSD